MLSGQKILNFIKYNNATTIVFVLVFFSFGVSFAASPEARDSVYASKETVISVDNGMIVSADLDNFNFNLRINSVTEDEKNYYAAYSYQVLAIEDGFWQNKEIKKTLTVSKEALGGKDLGLYVAKELGDNINYELSYLKKVQKMEKEKGESQKVVTVTYSGLIGKLLDPKEKVIEGYSPVIPEPVPAVLATVESNPAAVIVSTLHQEPQEESAVQSPQNAPASVTGSLLPAVNAPLVQDVVGELIKDNATSSVGAEPATSTPETAPSPVIESTSTPEVAPSPAIEATSTPEIAPASVVEATSTPEAAPMTVQEPPQDVATSTPVSESASSTTEAASATVQ